MGQTTVQKDRIKQFTLITAAPSANVTENRGLQKQISLEAILNEQADKLEFRSGNTAFVGRYRCQVQQVLPDGKVSVHFRKAMNPTKRNFIYKKMKKFMKRTNPDDDVAQTMIVPREILSKNKSARRRLGWKPSHDIPRRREGFHH